MPLGKEHFDSDTEFILTDIIGNEAVGDNDTAGLLISENEEISSQSDVFDSAKETLLLVEDNGELRYFLKTIFNPYFNIVEAVDGVAGFNMAKEVVPDVIISDVYSSKGDRTVQVPIWSEKDGQDDIRWYEATRQANGTYTVNVQATNHKNSTGLYNIHLYYILNDGSQVGVGWTTTTVEFRNAKTKTQTYITNVNSEAGSFTVVVDQAPQGRQIKNIRVAVWSESN